MLLIKLKISVWKKNSVPDPVYFELLITLEETLKEETSCLYLLAISQRQHKVPTQRLQVGLRLLQVCQGLVQRHPRWVRPLLLVAASLPGLLCQLAQGFSGAFYHLRPRLDTQLKSDERQTGRWTGAGKTDEIK